MKFNPMIKNENIDNQSEEDKMLNEINGLQSRVKLAEQRALFLEELMGEIIKTKWYTQAMRIAEFATESNKYLV
jgi:hypothetical protein